MSPQTMAEALAPLARRMVREHEVLRITATLQTDNAEKTARAARGEILAWAQNRSGGRLPPEAWERESFEYFAGGRNSVGLRMHTSDGDVWAIRADDPDKIIPGRIWTNEVAVWFDNEHPPQFSARLLVSSPEENLEIEPHSPGYVQQLCENYPLYSGPHRLHIPPWLIASEDEAEALGDLLEDPGRTLPIFVLSVPEDASTAQTPLIEPHSLARATLGTAHIVVLPAEYTWVLTNRFGQARSVFLGSVRTYLPGFAQDANPYDHRLFLADNIRMDGGKAQCIRLLRQFSATNSIRRIRVGQDIYPFAAIRSAGLRLQQRLLADTGASEGEQLVTAEQRIEALEAEIAQAREMENYILQDQAVADERAQDAEKRANAATSRIQQLITQIRSSGRSPDSDIPLPASWAEFSDWCDEMLSGRIVLSSAARRGAKAADFSDVRLVAQCMLWLANDYRDRRTEGGGSLRDESVVEGVRNAPCGGDTFNFSWQGQSLIADWHIKNGGNTRDPIRCLRIYYAWDPNSQQVVIADMPAHRRNHLS